MKLDNSYDIPVSLSLSEVLPDIFDWLYTRDLDHMKDWVYTRSNSFKDDHGFTFTFFKQEHAVMFALRWA